MPLFHAKLRNQERPETDYERWIREQGEESNPGTSPSFDSEENTSFTSDRDDRSDSQKTSHGHFIFAPDRYASEAPRGSVLPPNARSPCLDDGIVVFLSLMIVVIFFVSLVRSIKEARMRRYIRDYNPLLCESTWAQHPSVQKWWQ